MHSTTSASHSAVGSGLTSIFSTLTADALEAVLPLLERSARRALPLAFLPPADPDGLPRFEARFSTLRVPATWTLRATQKDKW
eukprot:m.302197 g.302197  ORF g.302197 m.302197 type:complete len:83 (-) comp15886_c1_seq9:5350-5598(-)